jgi:hypothetical protein
MGLETVPTNQEQFFQYTQDIIRPYLKEKIEKSSETDSIFGKISGTVKTVPRSYFDISFDANKNNLESTVESLLREKFSAMNIDSDTKFEELTAEVFTAPASEKDKPAEDREGSGGYNSLI